MSGKVLLQDIFDGQFYCMRIDVYYIMWGERQSGAHQLYVPHLAHVAHVSQVHLTWHRPNAVAAG